MKSNSPTTETSECGEVPFAIDSIYISRDAGLWGRWFVSNNGVPLPVRFVRAGSQPQTEIAVEVARDIVKKVSDAAIELAFTRHSLTTTDYEETDYPDVEEGVEAFKELVEDVKADVLACLTGDDTGCLDPEDLDYDNEMEFTRRVIIRALASSAPAQPEQGKSSYRECLGYARQELITQAEWWDSEIDAEHPEYRSRAEQARLMAADIEKVVGGAKYGEFAPQATKEYECNLLCDIHCPKERHEQS